MNSLVCIYSLFYGVKKFYETIDGMQRVEVVKRLEIQMKKSIIVCVIFLERGLLLLE